MAECPCCFGEGCHDMRDSDAMIAEHWTEEQIRVAKMRGMIHPIGIVVCGECEGSGLVSEERAADLKAAAIAAIDQVAAKLKDEGYDP